MNKRIIQLQKKISDAIQYFPADKPSRPIPFLSQIVWVPVKVKASQCIQLIGVCCPLYPGLVIVRVISNLLIHIMLVLIVV